MLSPLPEPLRTTEDFRPAGPQDSPPQAPRLDDIGNAARLASLVDGDLLFVREWGWQSWDGHRWVDDAGRRIQECAKAVVASLHIDAAREPNDERRKQLGRWAIQSGSATKVRAMIEMAESIPVLQARPEDFDSDPWVLNVRNGTINLRTLELGPHRPENRNTKLAPVDFDPDAKCPVFEAFLERIQPDPTVRRFVQEGVGYSLTGSTEEQVLFLLHGAGSNGKTTFTETVRKVQGDYAHAAEADLLMASRADRPHSEGIASLRGRRFVTASEVTDGRRFDEALVKRVTGSEELTARRLYGHEFTFTPSHKIWLATNHRPVIRGSDNAIWRRLRLIPFTVTIGDDTKDPKLLAKLAGELPGILNWALEGLRSWHAHGLSTPPAVLDATAGYRSDMDTLGTFLEEACIEGEFASVAAGAIYGAYCTWARDNGEHVMSQRSLGTALGERGYQRRRRGEANRWHWEGLGLRADDQHIHADQQRLTNP